ncbi:MAG: sigma-70 family RNA polymerase sigma factor [Pirellulales bacterium]
MSEADQERLDAQLIRRLVEGDEGVLRTIFATVVPDVWALLNRRFFDVLGHEELEEVVVEAVYRLWVQRRRLDSEKGDLAAWLYVIARNLAFDRLRRSRRQTTPPSQRYTLKRVGGEERVPDEELLEIMQRAFRKLNARERIVVAPLLAADSTAPSARVLGRRLRLSDGGVRALRFRGVRKLTRTLHEMGYDLVRLRPDSRIE